MRVDPKNPRDPDRDRFVLSKGHAAPCYYGVLAELGFFDRAEFETFRQLHGMLQGHPDMKKTPGVDASTGSLGQGVSIAVGMALAAKHMGKDTKVFTVLGDGECQEGQVWEAFRVNAHLGAEDGADQLHGGQGAAGVAAARVCRHVDDVPAHGGAEALQLRCVHVHVTSVVVSDLFIGYRTWGTKSIFSPAFPRPGGAAAGRRQGPPLSACSGHGRSAARSIAGAERTHCHISSGAALPGKTAPGGSVFGVFVKINGVFSVKTDEIALKYIKMRSDLHEKRDFQNPHIFCTNQSIYRYPVRVL